MPRNRQRRAQPPLSIDRRSNTAALDRAAARLGGIVKRNPYAGSAEFRIDRLLLEMWPAGRASRWSDVAQRLREVVAQAPGDDHAS